MARHWRDCRGDHGASRADSTRSVSRPRGRAFLGVDHDHEKTHSYRSRASQKFGVYRTLMGLIYRLAQSSTIPPRLWSTSARDRWLRARTIRALVPRITWEHETDFLEKFIKQHGRSLCDKVRDRGSWEHFGGIYWGETLTSDFLSQRGLYERTGIEFPPENEKALYKEVL